MNSFCKENCCQWWLNSLQQKILSPLLATLKHSFETTLWLFITVDKSFLKMCYTLNMDERQPKTIELRNIGWSWSAIGNYFGISKARAHQIGSGYSINKGLIKKILSRDFHTCQWQEKCDGHEGIRLVVHHIDFNDTNNLPENLITLCRPCHRYFHSKFHVDYKKEESLQNGHWWHTKLVKKLCRNCEKEMKMTPCKAKEQVFCSPKCRNEKTQKKFTRKCDYCGKLFVVPKMTRGNYYRSPEKFKEKSYCNRQCFSNSRKKA